MAGKKKTEKQREIYDFIDGYIKEHKYAPSYREIGEGVNLRSSSTVANHIMNMFENGMLETDLGFSSPRALRLGERQ